MNDLLLLKRAPEGRRGEAEGNRMRGEKVRARKVRVKPLIER